MVESTEIIDAPAQEMATAEVGRAIPFVVVADEADEQESLPEFSISTEAMTVLGQMQGS
jgi:hypothetical protein